MIYRFKLPFNGIFYKIYKLLDNRNKILFLSVILTSIIGSLAEFSSLSLVIPALNIVFGEGAYFSDFSFLSNFNIDNQRLIVLIIITIGIFACSLLKILSQKVALRVNDKLTNNLFINVYRTSLKKEILDFLEVNSTSLIASLTEGSLAFSYSIFQIANLVASSILLTTIIFLLLSIYPRITFFVFLASSSFFIIFSLFVRNNVKSYGLVIKELNEKRLFNLREGFGNFRQISLYNQSEIFVDKVKNIDYRFRLSSSECTFLGLVPKPVIEFLAVTSILFIAFLNYGTNNDQLLIVIGLFVIAANKIISAMNAINISFFSIQAKIPLVESFINGIKKGSYSPKNNFYERISWEKIKFENVSFKYKYSSKPIFENVNFNLYKGEKISLMGETGSGKSTLCDILMGLLPPTTGKVKIDGKDLYKNNLLRYKWKNSIANVPQEEFFSDDSLLKNITYSDPTRIHSEDEIINILREAKIDFVKSDFQSIFKYKIGEDGSLLSGGQRQRISIARALYRNPSLLILDEATNALDEKTEFNLLKNLYNFDKNSTIISISHNSKLTSFSDRIFIIEQGTLTIN